MNLKSNRTAWLVATLWLIGATSAVAQSPRQPEEIRFARERSSLVCYEGPTSEPSCSGTGLTVYLRDRQIQHLDWTIETSTQFIHRQFYFTDARPTLTVETIHDKWDSRGEPLASPRLVSTKRYPLNAAAPTPYQKELRNHARFLIGDFQQHRKDFERVRPPQP